MSDVANGSFTSDQVTTVTFAPRYMAAEVKNLDDTNPVYITTDGSTPTVGGADCYVAWPGERVLVPNQAPLWWQGF